MRSSGASLLVLLPFVMAAPFIAALLQRRGVGRAVAYACGFGVLIAGTLLARAAR